MAAYAVLRNDELEPYRGKELYIRSALCGLAYVVLWGVFALLVFARRDHRRLWIWLFVVPPFVLVGRTVRLGNASISTSATACSITASISWRP